MRASRRATVPNFSTRANAETRAVMDKVAAKAAMLTALRFVFLLTAMLTLTGCPGPNYAPYDNMTNSPGVG